MSSKKLQINQIKKSKKNQSEEINSIEERIKDPKYKTELCKKWLDTGFCPYSTKCRFAHGNKDLLQKVQGKNYKKKPCKSFNEKGYCPYGSRCNFKHNERDLNEILLPYFIVDLYIKKEIRPYKRLPIFEELTNEHKSDCCSVSTLSNDDSVSASNCKKEKEKFNDKDKDRDKDNSSNNNNFNDINLSVSFPVLNSIKI